MDSRAVLVATGLNCRWPRKECCHFSRVWSNLPIKVLVSSQSLYTVHGLFFIALTKTMVYLGQVLSKPFTVVGVALPVYWLEEHFNLLGT